MVRVHVCRITLITLTCAMRFVVLRMIQIPNIFHGRITRMIQLPDLFHSSIKIMIQQPDLLHRT